MVGTCFGWSWTLNKPDFRIAWKRPWGDCALQFDGALLSTRIRVSEADGLLAEFEPAPELIEFVGPKAWYWCEPRTERIRRRDKTLSPKFHRVIKHLRPKHCLYHAHTDLRFRVPHITHWEPVTYQLESGLTREPRAVSIVQNHGWRGFRYAELRLRNRFITHPAVDLYGPLWSWKDFPMRAFGPPKNWCGDLGGGWGGEQKHHLLTRYKVAVCMENSFEPYYFTEKFVDAVRAGCIPVYHAHPSVARQFLKGAVWVDPADYEFDTDATLAAALALDQGEVAMTNQAWLCSQALKLTEGMHVFRRIMQILSDSSLFRRRFLSSWLAN